MHSFSLSLTHTHTTHTQNFHTSHAQQGMKSFSEGDLVQSLEYFDEAEAADPRYSKLLWQRGLINTYIHTHTHTTHTHTHTYTHKFILCLSLSLSSSLTRKHLAKYRAIAVLFGRLYWLQETVLTRR